MASSVYRRVLEFKDRHPKTIGWRLKKNSAIVEMHLNPNEEVLYASILIFESVTNSLTVSIYTFPQINPLDTFKSLNISGVIESRKYPNTTLFLPINILLLVNATTALPNILNGLSFF